MSTSIYITDRINGLLDTSRDNLHVPKESLICSIFILALTDPASVQRAAALSAYLGNRGVQALENAEL
jgi:hypothetical protein